MTDYKGFYEAMVEQAELIENFVGNKGLLGLTDDEADLLHIIATNIVTAAEDHVPGGLHTEFFDIIYKEEA